jgi:ParB-like chromosome segregation protein Spo0J
MNADRVKELSLSRIIAHQEIQARVAMNKEAIEEYAEAMRKGDKFPPVVVFRDDDVFYWLADGFHRFEAAKEAGRTFIQAEIRSGGKREAILYAVGANASHGLRRSREDKRNSVLKLLNDKEWSQWSDREIARQCTVSQPFVSKLRAELTDNVISENQVRIYRTKHGNLSAMNTRNIGRQRQRDKELEENQRELEDAIENGEVALADVPVRLQRRIESAHTSSISRRLALPSNHLVTEGQMQFECPMPMDDSCTCGEQPELINKFLATWENKVQSTWNHLTRESKRTVLERLGLLVIQDRQDEEVAVEEHDGHSDEQQSIIAMVCEKNGLTEDELREKIRWLWEGPYDEEDRAEELGITTEQLTQLEENLSGSGRPWDDEEELMAQRPAEI